MKKILFPILAAFILSACGDGATKKTESTETNSTETDINAGIRNSVGGIPDTTNSLNEAVVHDTTGTDSLNR